MSVHPGDRSLYKTVPQIGREMGREMSPTQAWSVGSFIRERWIAEHGHLPEKDLRQKSSLAGSHMLAIYPPSWHQRIRNAIHAAMAPPARQHDLFIAPALEWRQEPLPLPLC